MLLDNMILVFYTIEMCLKIMSMGLFINKVFLILIIFIEFIFKEMVLCFRGDYSDYRIYINHSL